MCHKISIFSSFITVYRLLGYDMPLFPISVNLFMLRHHAEGNFKYDVYTTWYSECLKCNSIEMLNSNTMQDIYIYIYIYMCVCKNDDCFCIVYAIAIV